MHTVRLTTAAFCTALSLAGAIPAAAGTLSQDPCTPGVQDGAPAGTGDVMPWQDLRTPDAQDAAFDAEHR